jgi:biofilm PGA synthesis N-glycosyltransferase PgaC
MPLMAERVPLGGWTRRERPAVGLRPTVRFAIAATLTLAYVAFCIVLSEPWRAQLEEALGPILAWAIPTTLAYIPAGVIGFLVFTLLLTRYELPDLDPGGGWPHVTILVAARNEEVVIGRTLERFAELRYPGSFDVVLADNGSTDDTVERAQEAAERLGLEYRRLPVPEPGKHRALNAALATVEAPIVVTVDADTFLQRDALRYLVARFLIEPQGQHVSACAGALVVENARSSFIARMQGWDFRLAINGVKRTQAAYNSTLVAQGAFSAYWTEDVRAVGGWPDAIGEDIVLTWALLGSRGVLQYEPVAVGFTVVPTRLGALLRQRSRWARGMFEGLRANPPYRQPRVLAKVLAGIDYLVPLIDVGVVFFWVPGVILLLFGYPLIVGWWSMLVVPVSLAIFGLLRRWQERHVFSRLGIRQEADRRGFLGFLFLYQPLVSAAALRGYARFLTGTKRSWK